jgi:hypothetical protein
MSSSFRTNPPSDYKQLAAQLEAEAATADLLAGLSHDAEKRRKSAQKAARADDILRRLSDRKPE